MKKLMATAVFVVVALAAGPALAENVPIIGPDTTVGEAPGEGPPGPIDVAPGEEPALVPPPSEEPAPPPPPPSEEPAPPPPSEEPAPPPPSEDPVPPPPSEEPIVDTGEVPAEDTNTPAEDKGPSNVGDGSESTTEAPDTSDPVVDTGDNAGSSEDTEDQKADSNDDTALDTGKNSDDKGGTGDKEDKKDSDKDKTDDTEQSQDQEADSGDVGQSVDITNTGDNVNMCIGVLQNANTGNSQNQGGVVQDDSEADEVSLEGGSRITVTPQLIVDCRQLILQIVMGQQPTATNTNLKSSQPKSGGVQVRTGGVQARGGGSQPRPISTMADARAAQRPNATPRALPRTGGLSGFDAALLGLFAGAPLIGGGLLLRRILR